MKPASSWTSWLSGSKTPDEKLLEEVEKSAKILSEIFRIAISTVESVDALISSRWRPLRLLGIAEVLLHGTPSVESERAFVSRNLPLASLTNQVLGTLLVDKQLDLLSLSNKSQEEDALRTWAIHGNQVRDILPRDYVEPHGNMHSRAKSDVFIRLHWHASTWLWGMVSGNAANHEWMTRSMTDVLLENSVLDVLRSGTSFFSTLTLSEVLNWRRYGDMKSMTYADIASTAAIEVERDQRIPLNDEWKHNSSQQRRYLQQIDEWLTVKKFRRGKDVLYLSQVHQSPSTRDGSEQLISTHTSRFLEYQRQVGVRFSLLFIHGENGEAIRQKTCTPFDDDEDINVFCLIDQTSRRMEVILVLLRLGVDFGYVNTDVVFLRDPTEYFLQAAYGEISTNTQIGSFDLRRLGANSTRFMEEEVEWRDYEASNGRKAGRSPTLVPLQERVERAFNFHGRELDMLVAEHWDMNIFNLNIFFVRASKRTMQWFLSYYRWLHYMPFGHDKSGFDAFGRRKNEELQQVLLCHPWGRNETHFEEQVSVRVGSLNLNEFASTIGYTGPVRKNGWTPFTFDTSSSTSTSTSNHGWYRKKLMDHLFSDKHSFNFEEFVLDELKYIKNATDIDDQVPLPSVSLSLLNGGSMFDKFDWRRVAESLGFQVASPKIGCRNFRRGSRTRFIPSLTRG